MKISFEFTSDASDFKKIDNFPKYFVFREIFLKSHSPQCSWHKSMGNCSIVMSINFLITNFFDLKLIFKNFCAISWSEKLCLYPPWRSFEVAPASTYSTGGTVQVRTTKSWFKFSRCTTQFSISITKFTQLFK